jgi:uncharacterized protein YvpB
MKPGLTSKYPVSDSQSRRGSVPIASRKRGRRLTLLALLALSVLAQVAFVPVGDARAQDGQVITPDGRIYDAYVPAATKPGQFYQYTCEFDAAWAVLATFGYDVPFEEMLAIVGHDTSIEPWYEETPDGFVIYGGDITQAFNGDYTHNLLARTTGAAMLKLFRHYGLQAEPAKSQEAIEEALDAGALIWMKATVDFLPWAPTTWVTPDGKTLPTVLGNDHAVVVMGYNAYGVVIRDVLGPTDTNWNRAYEYDVPWDLFLSVFEAQGADGVAVYPPGAAAPAPAPIQPEADEPEKVCC